MSIRRMRRDREVLLVLLRRFYADVRQHQVIGPIFNAHITDWPAHLEKIADFWSNVTGGPVRYSGPMPAKHVPLGIGSEHFDAWLDLWRRHCRMHLEAEAAANLIVAAEGLGERIQWVIGHHGGGMQIACTGSTTQSRIREPFTPDSSGLTRFS